MRKTLRALMITSLVLVLFPAITHAQIPAKKWAADICVTLADTFNIVNSKVEVSAGGDIYIMVACEQSSLQRQFLKIYKSTNEGLSFSSLITLMYDMNEHKLQDADMILHADTVGVMNIFIAELVNAGNSGLNSSYVRISRWDPLGVYIADEYSKAFGSATLASIAIASDYRSRGDNFSNDEANIVFAYTGSDFYNTNFDFLNFGFSINNGQDFSTEDTLYTANRPTEGHLEKVSIAIGNTLGYKYSRYVIAFEMNNYGGLGNIGVLCDYVLGSGLWDEPVVVNLADLATSPYCKNPVVCVMQDNAYKPTDNSFPVIVAYEDHHDGATIKMSLLNSTYVMTPINQPNVSDFYYQNTTNNVYQPDMVYDPASANFWLTYVKGGTNELSFATRSVDDGDGVGFTDVRSYRDNTSAFLVQPYPRIAVNSTYGMPCFTWNEAVAGESDVYFDAQWSEAGISDQSGSASIDVSYYPNPANDILNVKASVSADYTLVLYNNVGQKVLDQHFSGNECQCDLRELTAGLYIIKLNATGIQAQGKLMIQ